MTTHELEARSGSGATPTRPGAPSPTPAVPTSRRARRGGSVAASGEPMVWVLAAGQVIAVLMIVSFVGLIFYQGFLTFWPRPVVSLRLQNDGQVLGEVARHELYRPAAPAEEVVSTRLEPRELIRMGNYDLYGDDYRWIPARDVARTELPADAVLLERMEWGVFVGFVEEIRVDGNAVAKGRVEAWTRFEQEHAAARALHHRARRLEKHEIGSLDDQIESERLELRRVELREGASSPAWERAAAECARRTAEVMARRNQLNQELVRLKTEIARRTMVVAEIGGKTKEMPVAEVVRGYRPNSVSWGDKLGIYLSRWWEFLTDAPREANTEGGVAPAIFGTVAMTMIMAFIVAPFGVLAALYLREYARQGAFVSLVRIAVNNLAGVPSIVFGVFGLGFFCYVVGGSIDRVFFAEKLPSPTFGTGGVLWASMTLALMTLPVVIVATEEALAAVPRSMREGAYACGASKWQMIRTIVIPRAMPGILTGVLLAMARGAGEVAPLMITGVVKLASDLPVDGSFPFLHLNRSFMHLGFHIYDVGFQSRNAEVGKPMVYTTTLLLLSVILLMNLTVISVRGRLRRKFSGGMF